MPVTKVVPRDSASLYKTLEEFLPKQLERSDGRPRAMRIHIRWDPPKEDSQFAEDIYDSASTLSEIAGKITDILFSSIRDVDRRFDAVVRIRRGKRWYKVAHIRVPENVKEALIVTIWNL